MKVVEFGELDKVGDEEYRTYPGMRGIAELCLDIVQAIALFRLVELALDLVSLVELPFPFPLFINGFGGRFPFGETVILMPLSLHQFLFALAP